MTYQAFLKAKLVFLLALSSQPSLEGRTVFFRFVIPPVLYLDFRISSSLLSKVNLKRKEFFSVNPIALRKAKIVYSFNLSECSKCKSGAVVIGKNLILRASYVYLE